MLPLTPKSYAGIFRCLSELNHRYFKRLSRSDRTDFRNRTIHQLHSLLYAIDLRYVNGAPSPHGLY
jgi:hypothetical protein